MERGRIYRLPKFFGIPYYFRNRKGYGLHILYEYSQGQLEQKAMKNCKEK